MATSTEQGLMVFQELYVLTAQPKRRALHITHPYHQPVCVRSKQRSKYPGTKRSPLLPLLGLFLTLHLHHAHENKTHFEFSGISQKRCWPNKQSKTALNANMKEALDQIAGKNTTTGKLRGVAGEGGRKEENTCK